MSETAEPTKESNEPPREEEPPVDGEAPSDDIELELEPEPEVVADEPQVVADEPEVEAEAEVEQPGEPEPAEEPAKAEEPEKADEPEWPEEPEQPEEVEIEEEPSVDEEAPAPEEVREQNLEPEAERELKEVKKQPLERRLEEEEEEPEKPLEEPQDTMQLPLANISERAIEDEEMPSMVTISSPSKIDESETNIKQDEERRFSDDGKDNDNKSSLRKEEDDNDNDSVCVIDDDDDEEVEEGSSYYDDEESSSYPDEDDESEEVLKVYQNSYYRRGERKPERREDDEEEEEDEDEEDEEEDDEAFNDKGRFERNPVNIDRRPPGKQYAHVQSKVKKYIMDMAEQRRMSCERRKKAQEEVRHRHQEMNEMQVRRSEEVVMTCKSIKGYTEKTLKEVAEYEENDDMYTVSQNLENGEISIFPRRTVGNGEQMSKQEEMEIDPIEVEPRKGDERSDKVNGTALNDNQNNFVPERKGILRREEYSSKPVLNGEDPLANPVCDLRTLSYEEYMKGCNSKDNSQEVTDIDKVMAEAQPASDVCNNNDSEASCVLRIENVVSNYVSPDKGDGAFRDKRSSVTMIHQSTETHYQDKNEVIVLKQQLDQRNAQFDNLRDAYQKTVSENMSMKMELENLRKMLAHYQEQEKPTPETKMSSTQTEEAVAPGRSMPLFDIDSSEQPMDPRLATTSMISSQWSDSTGSAAISMEPPPNVTNVLNSDESHQVKTPQKHKSAFSRAFMTSSKILQTLSNITHGRTKLDKYGKRKARESASEPSVSTQSERSEVGPSNSKKRKATEPIESSQPFKIPHTEGGRRKLTTPDPRSSNIQENGTNDDDDKTERPLMDEEDVKVFVYPEDEQGREHSFLIQAKEVSNNPKSGARECGPYLLGNVEVYMTEMNGTINIWGKELSQGSTNPGAEELDTTARSRDLRTSFRWQSTPRIFDGQGSASTGKKSRVVPRFVHPQPPPRACEATMPGCDSCGSGHNRRLSWTSCHQQSVLDASQHTCSPPTIRVEEAHCACVYREQRTPGSCCKTHKFLDARGCSMPNVYQQSHCTGHRADGCRQQQSFVRRHSFNGTDEDEANGSEDEGRNVSVQSCGAKLAPPCVSRKNSEGDCSDPPSCQNENDPLIFQKQALAEAMEARKPRMSGGKRVRGLLLDLLKGCGDCRTANPLDKTNLRQNASIYEPSTSASHRLPCSPNQPSCSLRVNDKCSSCRQRNDKTAEIEAQLEFFRVEMDKLRSRSDTLRDMLDTLRKDEIIN